MSLNNVDIKVKIKPGQWLRIDGELVIVETAVASDGGAECLVGYADGRFSKQMFTDAQLFAARVNTDDGRGQSAEALAGLWGRWMQYASPRLRSATLATRSLQPYAHQDEAVFDHMLPQPKLRFLLADEPGTGKTIMTGMYLVEARRRGLLPGPTMLIVPAHLVPKWHEELEDFFGIRADILTPDVARDPKDLDPRVDVWLASLDLYTHNSDVRRKAAGTRASWSLAVFDEAHRLTPTSRYLSAAQELAARSHHLLLLTATPHRGKEHYFRGLCNLLDPTLYPWDPEHDKYETRLRPGNMSFLRRMKETLRDVDGTRLFPERFAETIHIDLHPAEFDAYESVMEYAQKWYGDNAALALSIYGKRAASSMHAAEATLQRRLNALSGSETKRGHGHLPDAIAEGFNGTRLLSEGFEDPEDLARAEDLVVGAKTRDKRGEIEAVKAVLTQIRHVLNSGAVPSKWLRAEALLAKHDIAPNVGQLLVFTEFADTARWLAVRFCESGYTTKTLEGAVSHKDRYKLQQGFLDGDFQVLVSTDAGGEGINLQSAHVMIDWDIPWSLVRLEQRMGRLHRIGQKKAVFIYHLVAPATREGRVQQVMLENLEAAGESLGGRIFDLLDATAERAGGFDFAKAMMKAQSGIDPEIPDIASLQKAAEALVNEDKHLRSNVDQDAADARFRADRLEAINPVIVNGFIDAVASPMRWELGLGPAQGIRMLRSKTPLPTSFGHNKRCLIAADGKAVQRATSDAAGLDNVVVFGPTEPAFVDLVKLAVDAGRDQLIRGASLVDTGSITDYTLLLYEAELRMHDGVRQVAQPAPILIRWSGAGAFEVSWESLMSLSAAKTETPAKRPTPAQVSDSLAEANAALQRECNRQRSDRLSWVVKAKHQLNDLQDSVNDEIKDLPREERIQRGAAFKALKVERLAALAELERVHTTALRQVGWVQVAAGLSIDQLGYNPSAEKVAVAKVIAELESLDFVVDDRQTAGVGYDLLARHRKTGDQRCVEVKGLTEELGPIWLEQNEWAQALQKGNDYWLYVVISCGTSPVVRVRTQNPAQVFGEGTPHIQRFQIKASQLKQQAK